MLQRIKRMFRSDCIVLATHETILAAAKDRRLHEFLNDYYTIYYDPMWQEQLLLCKDLVKAGHLEAEFEENHRGLPEFLKGEPRITISGLEYLELVRQRKPWPRVLRSLWCPVFKYL